MTEPLHPPAEPAGVGPQRRQRSSARPWCRGEPAAVSPLDSLTGRPGSHPDQWPVRLPWLPSTRTMMSMGASAGRDPRLRTYANSTRASGHLLGDDHRPVRVLRDRLGDAPEHAPARGPCPRDPTTIMSASRLSARLTSSSAGSPSRISESAPIPALRCRLDGLGHGRACRRGRDRQCVRNTSLRASRMVTCERRRT